MKKVSLFLMLVFAGTAVLASPNPNPVAVDQRTVAWWDAVSEQLAASLDSPIQHVKEQSLQQLIHIATSHRDKIDVDQVVPALVDVYELNNDDRMRTMALVALHAIGDDATMQYLRDNLEHERSDRLYKMTRFVLKNHFSE